MDISGNFVFPKKMLGDLPIRHWRSSYSDWWPPPLTQKQFLKYKYQHNPPRKYLINQIFEGGGLLSQNRT